MTVSDPMPEQGAEGVRLLRPVSDQALVLALVALGFLIATLVLWQGAAPMASMVVGSIGVSLLTLVALAQGVALWRARDDDAVLLACDAVLGADPDPVFLTDSHGTALAATRSARDLSGPVALLAKWRADPDEDVHRLTAQANEQGQALRLFRCGDTMVRVTVHRVNRTDALIWRFATVERDAASRNTSHAPQARPDEDAPRLAPLEVEPQGGDNARARFPASVPQWPGFEDLPVALAQIDATGQVTGANRLARGLLGIEDGPGPVFWDVVEGLGRPVADWLADAMAGRALGRPEVLRATRPTQETFVQIILRRMPGSERLVAVLSDATEFKSLEARFTQSQKMQAIGQLAGGVAHDFNNLLTAISGHCDLLLLNRDRFDADYNDLVQIHQNANRAAALVRQLLAFSRKQTLKPETLSLESLIEDLGHLLTRLVGEKINLALKHDPALGAIRADRRQLEQVLMNLVVNARDAMPMGGIIRIETEARHLQDDFAHGRARVPRGDYAVIRVIDEGVGIPAEIIDKIFEPFFTTKRLGEGTGLGLSTAYGIVKQMGGFIFADSVEGAGTTFTLFFAAVQGSVSRGDGATAPFERPTPGGAGPMNAGAVRTAPARLAPMADHKAGAVLLVEDEAPVRAFAARALRLKGFQVFEAPDGETALAFLADRAVKVDLFVTDVIMPGIDGPGWVAKALAERPGTPVVFVSGYTEDALNEALVRIPNAAFLGKPFSLGDLSETIARQLGR